MSKMNGTLEKEMLTWKGRYEKCNKSLLEMAQEVCYHGDKGKPRYVMPLYSALSWNKMPAF